MESGFVGTNARISFSSQKERLWLRGDMLPIRPHSIGVHNYGGWRCGACQLILLDCKQEAEPTRS